MNRTTRYFFLLQTIACLLFFSHAHAAPDSVQYIHYDITNGLPSNNVYSTIQDHNGYIWFATDKGAVRFNGYSFKVFNSSNGLPADDVYRLQEDSKGRMWLWMLTNKFGYLLGDNFHLLHFLRPIERTMYPGYIYEYYGHPCFSHAGPGPTNSFSIVDSDIAYSASVFELTNSTPHSFIRNELIVLTQDKIYCCIITSGRHSIPLYVIDIKKTPFIPVRLRNIPTGTIDTMINFHVTNYDAGSLFLFTGSGKIFSYDLPIGSMKAVDLMHNHLARDENMYTIIIQKNRNIVLLTNENIYYLDSNLNIARKTPFRNGVLKHFQLTDLIEDNKKNTWYSTNKAGAWLKMNCFYHADSNKLYNFTKQGVFKKQYSFWYDKLSNETYRMDTAGNYIKWHVPGKVFSYIAQWGDSNIKTFAMQRFSYLNAYSNVQVPGRQYKKVMLINVYKQLHLLDKVAQTHYMNPAWGIRINDSISLEGNSRSIASGRLYGDSFVYKVQNSIRANDGTYLQFAKKHIAYNNSHIALYDPITDTSLVFEPGVFIPALQQINYIRTDNSGNIFILTGKALLQFNLYRQTLYTVSLFFSPSNAQLEISGNNLVLAGEFGIAAAKINTDGTTGDFHCLENIGEDRYRQVNDVWAPGNGRIFVNTDKGLVQTTISNITHYGHEYNRQNNPFSVVATMPYNRSIQNGDTLLLNHTDNRLSFDAINFYGRGEVQYQYRIKELHDDWQQTKGEILLENIDPETYYTLQLKVQDKAWQSGEMNTVLYRPPYWYQTHTWKTISWICFGILLILSVFGVISIARYTATRAHLKKQMMTDLELRAIHSQINPHFIFNTLSTALYFISRKEYDNAYGHVNKFSHLLRSYLKSSHDRYVILSEEIDMLKRYIELQQERFEQRFTYTITVDNKLPAGNIQIPSLLLQPLVENAINHGLFHKKEAGWLKLHFEQGADHTALVCTIEDNGVGREQARLIKQESAVRKESFGTKLTDKLVNIFRQYEEMDISIGYTDKQLPETGTIVKLTIKNLKYVV